MSEKTKIEEQNSDKDEDWKDRALKFIKSYYIGFGGVQWHEFDILKDLDLISAKVCYALFGPPENKKAEKIEDAYEDNQKKEAKKIIEITKKIYLKSKLTKYQISFVFVYCKKGDQEFPVPLISIYVGEDKDGNDMRKFVDTQGRTYNCWNDWKKNNKLPQLEYCYPTKGFFTCSGDNRYEFNPLEDPDVEYGKSPKSSVLSKVLTVTDVSSTVVSIGSGIIGIASLFTPVAPVVLGVSAVGGISSAFYGVGRGVHQLVDKGIHGQSLSDLESLTVWFSLVTLPFHFVSSAVNGTLTLGAQQGRIFSSSMRMFATFLNFTTLGLDSVLFGFGIANLIEKAKNKALTPLDILQFSMSAFFFTNTLIQPKVASTIIRNAQEMHFDRIANTMNDEAAKQTFDNFLKENKASGSITDRSKIVRTINRMDDPQKFFKKVGPDASVKIGGRKGKTVILSDQNGHANRVRPNHFEGRYTMEKHIIQQGLVISKKGEKLLKGGYKTDNLSEVKLNEKKIFENLTDRQKIKINQTLKGNNVKKNPELIPKAHSIAEHMKCETADDLMSIIEILGKELEGKTGDDFKNCLKSIQVEDFAKGIQTDLIEAMKCAEKGGLHFEDPLKAVYHYRKHGQDFPDMINKFGNNLEVYLNNTKNKIFNDNNLRHVIQKENGISTKIFANKHDEFGVLTSTPNGQTISTMFRKDGIHNYYENDLAKFFENYDPQSVPEPIRTFSDNLARSMGFRCFHIYVVSNGNKEDIKNCREIDQEKEEEIVKFLAALSSV